MRAAVMALALLPTLAVAQVEERTLFAGDDVEHLVDGISSDQFEAKPDISHDLLTLYYASAKPGGQGELDLWVTTRAAQGEPFGPSSNVAELNSLGRDHTPTTNADGTYMVFSSSRDGGLGSDDAWEASRASADDPWGAPVNLAGLSSDKRDMGYTMTPDALCLYFTSNRGTPGGELEGDFDLFTATRADAGSPWSAPTKIDELNTPTSVEKFPSVTGDNLTLYYASNRPGSVPNTEGDPSDDTWVAMRPSTDSPWTIVENVFETNTPDNEYLMSVADDGSEFFFTADGATSLGSFDLYRTMAIPGVVRYGAATDGVFGAPRLRPLGTPFAGNEDFAIEVTEISPDGLGILLVTPADTGPGPLLVDINGPFFRVTFQNKEDGVPSGVIPSPIPALPELVGQTWYLQAIVFDEEGAGFIEKQPIAATPGLRLTVQAP